MAQGVGDQPAITIKDHQFEFVLKFKYVRTALTFFSSLSYGVSTFVRPLRSSIPFHMELVRSYGPYVLQFSFI